VQKKKQNKTNKQLRFDKSNDNTTKMLKIKKKAGKLLFSSDATDL